MFRVRVESVLEGKKKVRKQVSTDTFPSQAEADAFVESCIGKQEKLCWQAWGLMVAERHEEDGKLRVDYRPACTIFASLTQTYEVISA
ncbi:MAG: hypothetical protein J6W09_04435 [Bacteroidales bacterium]|nr:hypothetical protein [Bacteroidales bacterium]